MKKLLGYTAVFCTGVVIERVRMVRMLNEIAEENRQERAARMERFLSETR